MESVTLAGRMGMTAHLSPLLMKARRLGLGAPGDLERLAITRGLRYYDSRGDSRQGCPSATERPECVPDDALSNEELAIALLSPSAPYSQQRLRMGAAMLAAEGNLPESLARLATRERCGAVLRHIAACGQEVEPDNPFWNDLLERTPASPVPCRAEVLPHPSRFVAMTGLTRNGAGVIRQWIRPRKPVMT